MVHSNHLRYLVFGLLFLLAACSSTVGEPAPAPSQVKEPAAATVEQEAVPVEEVVTAKKDIKPEVIVSADEAQSEVAAAVEQMASTEEEAMPAETEAEEVAVEVHEVIAEEKNAAAQGPTEAQQQLLDSLAVKGTPPELFNEVWLNSEPLKLADLRGKVVIVEFWTFG
jgi:hypothetical protein